MVDLLNRRLLGRRNEREPPDRLSDEVRTGISDALGVDVRDISRDAVESIVFDIESLQRGKGDVEEGRSVGRRIVYLIRDALSGKRHEMADSYAKGVAEFIDEDESEVRDSGPVREYDEKLKKSLLG